MNSELIVDLRSDTVTRPPCEMLDAMMKAKVGDDVLGDDPTVNELEKLAAKTMGKESAVFVPSGTMGNQMAIASHTNRGEVVLAEENAHILYYEVGGPAIISAVLTRTIPSTKGIMDPQDIESRVMKATIHTPGSTLLCIENTHNRAGGTVTSISRMRDFRAVADRHGMKIHLDGARIFNASIFLGVDVSELTKDADSVNFCLSKGLRSPIGSVLCGPKAFIERARVWRKRLGGGMRQAGFLAAAGIYSLNHCVGRLADDHRRTKELAEELKKNPCLGIDLNCVETNILMVEVPGSSAQWSSDLRQYGILCLPFGETRLRLVFHADVDDEGLCKTIEAFNGIAKSKH